MRKTTMVVGLVAVILIGGGLFLMTRNTSAGFQAQAVQTGMVERQTLNTTVEVSGSVESEQLLTLSFGASGTVKTVNVKVGDTATAGQKLATLDTTDLETQIALKEQALIVQQSNYDELIAPPTAKEIAQAQSNLASAQSNLKSAQNLLANQPNNLTINCSGVDSALRKLKTAQDDYDAYVKAGYEQDANFIPDADSDEGSALRDAQSAYDIDQAQCDNTTSQDTYQFQVQSARSSVDEAQASLDDLMTGPSDDDLKSSQASLDQAKLNLEDAKSALADAVITAPFSGVVSDVNLIPGQRVNSNTDVINLLDASRLHLVVDVDEEDIPAIKAGQSATITSDALGSQSLEATVVQITPAGTATDGIVTYEVRLDLVDAGSAALYTGMTVDAEIVVSSIADVLVVPTEAIQRTGTQEYVEILNTDGTRTPVNVTTGETVDGMTAIEGDLTAGVQVAIPDTTSTQSDGPGGPFGG